MHQVQKELLQFGFYKELEIVINPFRMIAWHPRSNETCFWVSSRHRCLLRDLRRMSIHFLWEDPHTFFNEEKKSRDIKNQRPSKYSGSNLSCLQIAYPARWDEREREVSKIWNAIKPYLFTVRCLSDDYKLIAIVWSCDEASICLHCLLQLPSLDPPPCNSPPLITSYVYRRSINPSTVLLNLSPQIHRNPSSNPHTFTCTHSSRVLPPSSTFNFFGGLKPHTKVQPPQQQKKGKRKKLLYYSSLKVDFAPSFWSFCLRSFDLPPNRNLGTEGIGVKRANQGDEYST